MRKLLNCKSFISVNLTCKVNDMLHNKVNINRLQQDMEKAQANIDELKDQARNLEAHNGK